MAAGASLAPELLARSEKADGVGLQFDSELLNDMLDNLLAIGHLDGAIVFARGEFTLHKNACAFGQPRSDLREALPVGNNRVPLRFVFPLAFVQSIKKGDRVVLPFNIGCGFCFNCSRQYTSACLTANPDTLGAGYGYSGMGPYKGGQAEFLRVPFANFNCLKLPGTPGDELEDDFVLLADIPPTGWHAAELANVKAGDSVAIFGAGPVGLLAAHACAIKGAAEIYVVDRAPKRLELAEEAGAVPVDFTKGDSVEQIKDLRQSNRQKQSALCPEEKKMPGVNCAIDAVGYQAHSGSDVRHEDPMQTIRWSAKILNPTGALGNWRLFPKDRAGVDQQAKKGTFDFPLGQLWEKGITIGQGQALVKKYNVYLRDLIIAGKAKPSFIVSHRLPLSEAPHAYAEFDKRGVDGGEAWTKVLLKPAMEEKTEPAHGKSKAASRS